MNHSSKSTSRLRVRYVLDIKPQKDSNYQITGKVIYACSNSELTQKIKKIYGPNASFTNTKS